MPPMLLEGSEAWRWLLQGAAATSDVSDGCFELVRRVQGGAVAEFLEPRHLAVAQREHHREIRVELLLNWRGACIVPERHDLVAGRDEFLRLEPRELDVLAHLLQKFDHCRLPVAFAGHRDVRSAAVDP